MQAVEIIYNVLSFTLLAWWVTSLSPLQIVLNTYGEEKPLFTHFIQPFFSCIWCATFWLNLIGLSIGYGLPYIFTLAFSASFIVKQIKQSHERRINR